MVAANAHHPPSPCLIHLPSTRPTIESLTPTGSACHASRRRFSLSSCTPVVTVLVTPLPSPQEIDSVDAVRSVCLHVANVNADPFESVHPLFLTEGTILHRAAQPRFTAGFVIGGSGTQVPVQLAA